MEVAGVLHWHSSLEERYSFTKRGTRRLFLYLKPSFSRFGDLPQGPLTHCDASFGQDVLGNTFVCKETLTVGREGKRFVDRMRSQEFEG